MKTKLKWKLKSINQINLKNRMIKIVNLIALDVGQARIGVAVGDSRVGLAVPYETIEVNGDEIEKIAEIVIMLTHL
jgi:hypothetical protein